MNKIYLNIENIINKRKVKFSTWVPDSFITKVATKSLHSEMLLKNPVVNSIWDMSSAEIFW